VNIPVELTEVVLVVRTVVVVVVVVVNVELVIIEVATKVVVVVVVLGTSKYADARSVTAVPPKAQFTPPALQPRSVIT
jgi:hypothetical protein